MVVLKKIKAATLVETLLASAIILIVFFIGSLTLNNVFLSSVKKDTTLLDNRVKELQYGLKHKMVTIPFYEETDSWDISINTEEAVYKMHVLHKASGNEKELIIEK